MKQPLFSPYGLIQESLWPNEWLILVSCVLLNCTSRKQVERVIPTFISKYETPEKLLNENEQAIIDLVSPLGFKNRRTKTLYKLANDYLKTDWKDALELSGIGEYAARAWRIFIKNDLGDSVPNDGALKAYFLWRKFQDRECC